MPSRFKRRLSDWNTPTPVFAFYERSEYFLHCWYCGIKLIFSKEGRQGPNGRSVDHIIPIRRGRNRPKRDDNGMKVPACRRCNEAKGNKSLETFRCEFFKNNKGELFFGEKRETEIKSRHGL